MKKTKKIYIVLSYSGTMPSKLIKLFTRYKYSHVSIALRKDIKEMYSFGRRKVYNPLIGGFKVEKKDGKFYKRFNDTECMIYELEVPQCKYFKVKQIIKRYVRNKEKYKYDLIGLFLRAFNKKIDRKYHFVCSEFVKNVLEEADIFSFEEKIVKIEDFSNIPNEKVIYSGYLLKY